MSTKYKKRSGPRIRDVNEPLDITVATDDEIHLRIARVVHDLRVERRINANVIAELLGISPSQYNRFESPNVPTVIQIPRLVTLMEFYDVDFQGIMRRAGLVLPDSAGGRGRPTADERRMVDLYGGLIGPQKDFVIRLLETLRDKGVETEPSLQVLEGGKSETSDNKNEAGGESAPAAQCAQGGDR